MAQEPKACALQLQDEALIKKALAVLRERGINADSVPVADCLPDELPDWSRSDAGGWFLRISADRFAEGMKVLEPVMGYTPD